MMFWVLHNFWCISDSGTIPSFLVTKLAKKTLISKSFLDSLSIKNSYISVEIGYPSVKFDYFLPPRHVLSYSQAPTTTATI